METDQQKMAAIRMYAREALETLPVSSQARHSLLAILGILSRGSAPPKKADKKEPKKKAKPRRPRKPLSAEHMEKFRAGHNAWLARQRVAGKNEQGGEAREAAVVDA